MKKLLFILPALFFVIGLKAQPTIKVNIGMKYGNFKGIIIPDTDKTARPVTGKTVQPVNGETVITGIVVSTGMLTNCINDNCETNIVNVKTKDGTLVTVGTLDHGFTLPGIIVNRTLTIEGIYADKYDREKMEAGADYQKNIQFSATGIKITN